jgi:hypothetical protein
MRVLLATALVLGLSVSQAGAQAGAPWLIEPTARALRLELWNRGIDVWSLDRAAGRFEEQGSKPPTELTDQQLQDWKARSKAAILPLASGDYAEALEQLSEAQELARRAPEQLNRDPERAREVLDTCLYMVRALQQAGSSSIAEGLAQECREQVLKGEPSTRMHPPPVLQALARVDEARVKQSGVIAVQSEPPGCGVRVNGVLLGDAPLEVTGLFPSQYRVQVECEPGQPSRVYETEVGFDRVQVLIDTRFDGVIGTRPILHLRYPSVEAEMQNRKADAERISEVVPAGALLLMREMSPGIVELELRRGSPTELQALVRVKAGAQGPTSGDVALATRALIDGECKDFSDPEVPTIECGKKAPAPPAGAVATEPDRRMPRGQFIAGLTLATAGSAALVTGYVLLLPRKNTAEQWIGEVDDPSVDSPPSQQHWLDLSSAIVWTSSLGAAGLVAAMPLVLPKYEKPPWWAWLSGGLGVGLTAFSIAYGVSSEAEPSSGCADSSILPADARTCVKRAEHVSLAVLTGVSAAPALTVPLVYLFRRADKKIVPTVEVSGSRGYLGVQGRF